MTEDLTLGVIGTSRKENERRLPIHPAQIGDLSEAVRERTWFEAGYAERFAVPDGEIAHRCAGVRPRDELIAECDVVLLPKPVVSDLELMAPGQVLCGWMHCVQDPELTQAAIDRRLTLLAWESMNLWSADGAYRLHVFHQNNELAGYASVVHAMQLVGATGAYGRPLRASVVGFGATGRGAVLALRAMGVNDVSVLTHRDATAVADPIHSARFFTYGTGGGSAPELDTDHETMALFLAEHDIVVNCVYQDPDAPLTYVTRDELADFRPGTLFVDVSVDAGMGFEWSRPTTFDDPIFGLGDGRSCYAVDHSPSLFWNSATWEISRALSPYLTALLAGEGAREAEETLRRAIEIREGVVENPKILSFQGREEDYPHRPRAGQSAGISGTEE
ncbi:MAG: N(5)-(carboxyethyl)ornithine synthase [Solirubrobacterales bacterium]|nr:N(5)-(carboxyethyl)ornithine synthase [Solirubrobacterales bacterium]